MAAVPLSKTAAYTLKIGSVAFEDLEHPESLPIPLEQQVAVHKQAGGTKTVQTFGVQPGPISWKGTLFFNGAIARMGQLRTIAAVGKEVQLSWGPLQWDVIVTKFEAEVHHQFEIAYDITCEVVRDRTGQAIVAAQTSLDAQNQALFSQMQARFQSLQVLDPGTSDWADQVDATGQALQNASPISGASSQQLAQTLAQVSATISTVQQYLGPLQSLTGSADLQKLFLAQGILSNLQVISANLGSGNPAKTELVMGASLVELATTHYGDPSLWTVIAAANGLWSMSPLSSAGTTLKIPPKPADSPNALPSNPVVYT
jgi:hypothetical protein